MKWLFVSTTQFLAVACELRLMSYDDANLVLRQKRLRSFASEAKRVGEIAVDMLLLTAGERDTVVLKQEEYRNNGRKCRDPERAKRPRLATRIGLLVGTVQLLAIPVVGLLTHWDWARIAIVITLLGGIVAALQLIVPLHQEMHLALDRFLRVALGAAAPLSLGVTVLLAYWLSPLHSQTLPFGLTHDAAWIWFAGNSLVYVMCSMAFLVGSIWRRREVLAHEQRAAVLQAALALLSRGGLAIDDCIRRSLETTAHVLSRNPWCALVARIARFARKPSAGLITTWYLVPNRQGRFHATARAIWPTTPLPQSVVEALDCLKDNYFPSRFDQRRFDKLKTECKIQSRRKWRRDFLNSPGRHEFASVTGYVFSKLRPLSTGDADRCLVFDRYYSRALPQSLQTAEVHSWLNCKSFAAFPVIPQGSSVPHGVILALRNTRNGILEEELDYLRCITEALGRNL